MFSYSSALPSVGELNEMAPTQGAAGASTAKKDIQKRNSVMLRNGSSGIIDSTTGKPASSSLAAAGSNVIGGIDNYRRY